MRHQTTSFPLLNDARNVGASRPSVKPRSRRAPAAPAASRRLHRPNRRSSAAPNGGRSGRFQQDQRRAKRLRVDLATAPPGHVLCDPGASRRIRRAPGKNIQDKPDLVQIGDRIALPVALRPSLRDWRENEPEDQGFLTYVDAQRTNLDILAGAIAFRQGGRNAGRHPLFGKYRGRKGLCRWWSSFCIANILYCRRRNARSLSLAVSL